jgi:hypothetical protein
MAATGQQRLPIPRNMEPVFEKETRSSRWGTPGPDYWQNAAHYDMRVNFDPVSRLVSGTVNIAYVNRSPNTLQQIVFKLYPNLYKKGNVRMMPVKPQDVTDGVHIESMQVNDTTVDSTHFQIMGTNMVVPVAPVPTNGMVQFSIKYSYTLNKTSHIRTGEIEPGADFVAYFFPRIAVYDDVDGWNMEPYLGPQEFYNDFDNFDVAITVPANYVVWATGDLTNSTEVLNPVYCQRLQTAEQQDGVVDIIDSIDLQQKNITRPNASNTWKFNATNVTDFAFAVSDHYLWKSTSLIVDSTTKRRTRVDAVFNPKHQDYYEVIGFARKTVEVMSFRFPKWPFPYSHETVFDGLDQMEYPMMVNDNPLESRAETIELVDHEIFHTLFPFYMGVNETKYAWMDEGWATIGEWIISPMIDTSLVDDYGVHGYEGEAGTDNDLPIITPSTQTAGTTYFINSYPKPALGYLYVKDMLGDSLFTHGLHYYMYNWQGKHPTPLDFFNCINSGTGKNLNWFWKKWFYDAGVPDLAIKKVNKQAGGYTIVVESKGSKPVPVELAINFTDGSKTTVRRSIAVWENATSVSLTVPTVKTIKNITLGGTYVPDVNRKDNVWGSK